MTSDAFTLSLCYKGCDLQGLDLQGVKHLLKIRVDLPPDRLSKVATRVDFYHYVISVGYGKGHYLNYRKYHCFLLRKLM